MTAKRVVVDLETYRTRNPLLVEALRKEQIEKRPAQNKSKEEKNNWDTSAGREERIAEALAKTAVDPMRAEILCIAVGIDDRSPISINAMPDDEFVALCEFTNLMDEEAGPETTWVGHNLQHFDLPVLLSRFRALGVNPPNHFPSWQGRYWAGRVYDTMLRTPNTNGLGLVSLEDACQAYGIPSSKTKFCLEDEAHTPLHGGTVRLAFERKEYAAIQRYAEEDIAVTRDLYLVQTFGCSRDCWEAEDGNLEVIREIRDSDLPPEQKAPLLLKALADKGLISREFLPRAVAA